MIRVLLADDNEIFLEGLVALVERDARLIVIGTATNGADAVQLADVLDPDVVLLDVLMPGMTGIEAAASIRAGIPDVGIVLTSALDDSATSAEARRAGATAFVAKHEAIDRLGDILVAAAPPRSTADLPAPPGATARDGCEACDSGGRRSPQA